MTSKLLTITNIITNITNKEEENNTKKLIKKKKEELKKEINIETEIEISISVFCLLSGLASQIIYVTLRLQSKT